MAISSLRSLSLVPPLPSKAPRSIAPNALSLHFPVTGGQITRGRRGGWVKAAAEGVAVGNRIKFMGTLRKTEGLIETVTKAFKDKTAACGVAGAGEGESDRCRAANEPMDEARKALLDFCQSLKVDGDPLHGFCNEHPESENCQTLVSYFGGFPKETRDALEAKMRALMEVVKVNRAKRAQMTPRSVRQMELLAAYIENCEKVIEACGDDKVDKDDKECGVAFEAMQQTRKAYMKEN